MYAQRESHQRDYRSNIKEIDQLIIPELIAGVKNDSTCPINENFAFSNTT